MTIDEKIEYVYCRQQEAVFKNGKYLAEFKYDSVITNYLEKAFGIMECNCNGYCKLKPNIPIS